ncbi:MAG: DUF6705 family protein [Bacteroidota bacterium]
MEKIIKTMKTTLYIFFSLFLSIGFAQEDETVSIHKIGRHDDGDINKTYYYKDIDGDLDKFLGTWQYDDGVKKLTLVFYKLTHVKRGKHYKDRIYARFKYEESGTVIYNTLSDFSSSVQRKMVGSFFYQSSTTKMNLFYNEPTDVPYDRILLPGQKPSPSLDIEYLSCAGLGCSPQLKWDINFIRGADSTDPIPFKIPLNLILTKQ